MRSRHDRPDYCFRRMLSLSYGYARVLGNCRRVFALRPCGRFCFGHLVSIESAESSMVALSTAAPVTIPRRMGVEESRLNHLLAALPPPELSALTPCLREVSLCRGAVLHEPG